MPLTLSLRGKTWSIRGTVAGQRVYESTRLDSKRAAEIIRTRREAEILERVTLGRPASLTFAEAALTYLETGGEARFLGPILAHFGPRFRLIDVDNAEVNRCAQALYPTAAPATINRQVIAPISAVYNLAAEDQAVAARRFRRRKTPPARKRWLTPEEAELLLGQCDAHLRPKIGFLLGTGARTGEMIRLQVDGLHLDTGEAWVQMSKNGEPKMLTFPTRTRAILASHGLPDAGAVFRTPKGKPYALRDHGGGQIEAAFTKARTAAGLGPDVTPHVLRHTWATWHWAQNRDLLALMTRGGWKTPQIALAYTKLAPADLPDRLRVFGWDFTPGAKSVHDTQGMEGIPIENRALRGV